MTRVLVKLRFWTLQLGSGSSHPRWMRKRQENAKKMTPQNGNEKKKTKPNDKKMTTINIQQPSEFAGKIFIKILFRDGFQHGSFSTRRSLRYHTCM
jgi:hypothetical protein